MSRIEKAVIEASKEREGNEMEKQLRDYVEELLKDYDKLYDLLWGMMEEAYTTKNQYLGEYRLMVWDDGTIDTRYMERNEWYRAEQEGTAYCVAAVKEWNNEDHDDWEEPGDTFTDTTKRIMMEYKEQIDDEIGDIIEQATWNYEHID